MLPQTDLISSILLDDVTHPMERALSFLSNGDELSCISCVSSIISLSLSLFHVPSPQDQYDIIDKHTQSGLELVEKYVKFVKERTEIEQNYAKQLR